MASGACSSHLEGAKVNGLTRRQTPDAGACGWHLKLKLKVGLFFGRRLERGEIRA